MKNLLYKLRWLSIYNSPFIRPSISFYFGKISRGVPYFLPRRWKNMTYEEAERSVHEDIEKKIKVLSKIGKTHELLSSKEMQSLIKQKQRSQIAKPTKWQIALVGLGWKTKWESYRHEWNPMLSIVGFNRQFCIYIGFNEFTINSCYWEAYLYYKYDTKGTVKERVKQCRENHSVTWGNKEKGYTDYYTKILKKKYL